MLSDEEKQAIIAEKLGAHSESFVCKKVFFKGVLPDKPTIDDLFQFSNLKRPKRWKRNRRLNKKFHKRWFKYVPHRIFIEFICKLMSQPLRQRLDYESVARKAFKVEPMPIPNALASGANLNDKT